jgi:hypothetical protein
MKTGFSRAGDWRESRIIRRDLAADWRRWTNRERIAAGILGTGIPVVYVMLTFNAWL